LRPRHLANLWQPLRARYAKGAADHRSVRMYGLRPVTDFTSRPSLTAAWYASRVVFVAASLPSRWIIREMAARKKNATTSPRITISLLFIEVPSTPQPRANAGLFSVAWVWYVWLPRGGFYGRVALRHFVPALITIVVFAARGGRSATTFIGAHSRSVWISILGAGGGISRSGALARRVTLGVHGRA
jgi:hypothetical protein